MNEAGFKAIVKQTRNLAMQGLGPCQPPTSSVLYLCEIISEHPDLKWWYVYPTDSGHCILAVLHRGWGGSQGKILLETGNVKAIAGMMVPIPLKSVLRGYQVINGFILATSEALAYDDEVGLINPPEDDQF